MKTVIPPLPEWITLGAKVATLQSPNYGSTSVRLRTVDRITDTQVILSDGGRFDRRKALRAIGYSDHRSYANRPTLYPIDAPEVLRVAHERKLRMAVDLLTADLDKFRQSVGKHTFDPAAATAILNAAAELENLANQPN